ncbi:MAG: PepSY domain-containing protein [ANME-2 cluster archaeon]|nr:PepSY domain-containing protein [ANME-2 cluster archaeon]
MKNKFVIVSICLIVIGLIAIAMASQNSGMDGLNFNNVKNPITKEQASNIAAKSLPVDKSQINLRSDDTNIYWEFDYIDGKDVTIIDIDANAGQTIGYFNSSRAGNKTSITSNKALMMAKTQLVEYAIDIDSLEVLQASVELIEYPHEKMYAIVWTQQKNGVPVYGNFISVRIDANTGELISFVEKIADESSMAAIDTTPEIIREDAIKAANEFLNKSYGLPHDSKLMSSSLEIRKPNDWANTRNTNPTGSYTLAWIITFEDETRGDGAIVQAWMDGHTGEVIGGDRCK